MNESDNNNNKNNTNTILVALLCASVIFNLFMSEAIGIMAQYGNKEDETTEETEVTEAIEEELNSVYKDLDIEDIDRVTISESGEYFVYEIYNDKEKVINFIEKVDKSKDYEMIDSYKYSACTYVMFKYTDNNVMDEQIHEDRDIE